MKPITAFVLGIAMGATTGIQLGWFIYRGHPPTRPAVANKAAEPRHLYLYTLDLSEPSMNGYLCWSPCTMRVNSDTQVRSAEVMPPPTAETDARP